MAAFIHIPSTSSDMEYLVDPVALTCECRDWTERRQQFPRSDPRRLCKHLLMAISNEVTIPDCLAQYEETFMRYSNFEDRGFPLAQAWTTVRIKGQDYDIFLPPTSRDSWINIYSDDGKLGYHRFEERWSYNEEPEISDEILAVINNLEAKVRDKKPRQNKIDIQDHTTVSQYSGNQVIICPFCSMEFTPEDIAHRITCPVCGERLDGKPSTNTHQPDPWQAPSSLSTPWDSWIMGLFLLIGMAILLGWCARM